LSNVSLLVEMIKRQELEDIWKNGYFKAGNLCL